MQEHQGQQKQQQQQQQQWQQHLQPRRDTHHSCDFCTSERLRCDGLLPWCSRCTNLNKTHCHYRKVQSAKSKPKVTAVPRRRDYSSTKRPLKVLQSASDGDTVAPIRRWSTSDLSRSFSLKRCQLSASPATGLVGMKESAFLNDYFACLGFLPLACASVVRRAMVTIMLGSMPEQRQKRFRGGAVSPPRGENAGFPQQGQDRGRVQVLACQSRMDDPSKCIFWCAVALGALLQGCSSEFVTGYLKLAHDSLAECFDGSTVETARAYLVMAFLYRFLGDKENNHKYLAFAGSIVERLPQDVIPSGMEHMLLAQGDESRCIHYGCSGSVVGGTAEEETEYNNQIPKVNIFMHENDLCSFYFLAANYLHKAFLEDIRSEVDLAKITREAGGWAHGKDVEGEPQEQGNCKRIPLVGDREGGGLEASLRPSGFVNKPATSRDHRDHPHGGGAIEACIKEVLPDMARLLAVMERSGTCSGVGALLFHGCVAYMKAIKGEMRSSFESLKVCAGVLMRFPGICRYRPHLVHSILTAAASSSCRDVYNPVREIYNSILPWNGMPVPPMEDWGGVNSICNHVLCRSLLAETNKMDFSSNKLGFSHARAVAASVSTTHSSGLHISSVTGESRRWLDCRGCGAQSAAASVREAGTVSTSRFTNGALLTSPIIAQISLQQRTGIAAGEKAQTESWT